MGTSKHTQVHFFAAAEYPRSHSSSISLAALAAILAIFSLSGCGGLASTEKKTSRITLTVNSSSINFGNISVGSSATQSLIITNIGIPAVNVSQATISGAGFALVGANLTYSIPGGQSSTIQIQFAPLSTGDVTGSLSILSNASNPLLAIALAGTGAQPGLATSPASVNFGNVTVGQNSSQNIKLTNSGNADLALSLATVSGNGFGISGLSVPTTISPGQSLSFNGHFAPTAAGGATGSITFADNAAGSPQTLTLSGSGVTASATLSANPGSIAFGNIVVGNTSTQTITLANSGSTNVTISQISSSGTGFNASGLATPMTLAAGQSATFTAQFAPAAAGNTSGSITLTSDASNPTLTIALSGTGTQGQLAANPASVSFGNVLVGSSGSQTVTLTNSGTASVTLSAASASGTGFSISGLSLPLTLAAGQNTTLTAQFAPSATGSASGTASITSNAPGSPLTIALSGTGVAATFLLGANPASLSYGNVNVGSTGSLAVTLTNSGNSNVTVSSVTVTGTGFSASGVSAGATLTPNQSVTLNVAFAPTAAGSVTGSVSVASNATNSPATIGLSGTAVQGTLASNPASVSFGNVLVGSSASQTVTLTNSGTASVTISAASASGTGFSISGLSLPLTLAAGQNTTFTAQFAPSATGSASGTASITSNAPGSPLTIALSGTGTQPQLSPTPTSVSFGSLVTGTNTSQTITLKNTGTASLTISQATVSGAGFTITGLTVPVTIAAGGSTTFSAAFAPTTAGSVTGSISLVSNAPGSPLAILLSGTGVAATFLLGANPTSLSFGNVNVAGSSSLSATLTNTGNSNVTVSSVTVTGTGFSASGVSAGTTLTPNQSLTLNVAFAPTAAGSVTGSVSVASNATNSPAVISLSGAGVQPQISVVPASVSFGNVVVGTKNTQTITLKNTGTANLSVSQATVSGSGFATSGLTLPLTLTPGQSTNFSVAFAPAGVGSVTGSVSLVSNAPGSPTAIPLSGSGVAATLQLSASPTSLSFGNVSVGSSITQSVTLTNTGNSSVSISQINVSGVAFSASGLTPPLTLAAGQSTNFSVIFLPATSGSLTGSVSVVSNATNSPATIALSGTGVSHSVTLSWTASTSSVVGYYVYRGTLTGGPYTKLNSTPLVTITYDDSTVQSGLIYFYVVTAMDSNNVESVHSNEISATIPIP